MQANWTDLEAYLEVLRQAIPGGPAGWQAERLIFRDFWHWKEHELGFAHGRLALTGMNESGKSTLLALVLPPLFDGDTSPVRLDPALSRDRYLHWYLLGDDNADPDDEQAFAYRARTGYIALEFRHGTSGAYITIGMGIAASRTNQRKIRDWWGFIIPTLRVGREFDVRGTDGYCLDRRGLAERVPAATICTERGDYRQKVNAHLFQMPDDDYQALIRMLVQARRPKLGEQVGPEEVCNDLRKALPGMSEEKLERVSQVVQNLERHQRNLQEVTDLAGCVDELDRHLLALAEALVQEASAQYQTVQGQLGRAVQQRNQWETAARNTADERERVATESAKRKARLTEIDITLDEYRRDGKAELPLRLEAAKTRLRQEQQELERIRGLQNHQHARIQAIVGNMASLAERFQTQTKVQSQEADRLARHAAGAGWDALADALRDAAREVITLSVTDDAGEVEAIRPDSAWADRAASLIAAYEQLLDRRKAMEAARDEHDRHQHALRELREHQTRNLEAEQAAETRVHERREAVLLGLRGWHQQSLSSDIPDHVLAMVHQSVSSLLEPPESGHGALTGPIRTAAQQQRTAAEERAAAEAERGMRLRVREKQLREHLEQLERTGLLPVRSEVRTAARSACDLPPLYRWLRFRPGVHAETAGLVEAALLEAGLLDLLLLPNPAMAARADAWAVPTPIRGQATLADVLEPEAGAPALVGDILASIGWGRGAGPQWIAADGTWSTGVAHGNVAAWMHEAAGLIGEERRQAALRQRLNAIQEELARTRAAAQDADAAAARAREWVAAIAAEFDALAALPWQSLFGALETWTQRRADTEMARSRAEHYRPEVDRALSTFQAAEAGYSAVSAGMPAARGLDAVALRERIAEVDRLAGLVSDHARRYDLLSQTIADHGGNASDRAQLQQLVANLQGDEQARIARVTAATTEVAALDARLIEPSEAALQARISALRTEEAGLKLQEQPVATLLSELVGKFHEAGVKAETFRAEEEQRRSELSGRLQRLKVRLRLHPSLTPLAEAMDRESPITVVQRLPKSIESEALESAIDTRRADAMLFINRHLDQLGEFHPGWEGDTAVLTQDRERITAAALVGRLTAQRDEYAQLITRDERNLYQQILYQGVLTELRKLIREARLFTNRLNGKLEQARRSTGMQLQLRLRTRPVDKHPGAAIGAVLEQQDQGVEYLPDEQRDMLIAHIEQEVERVRHEMQLKGEAAGYLDAIKGALDYRNWYEYELIMSKPGSKPEVLRNRGFGKHSSSAKAWALVVPMVAGVAARYDAASKPDAPRLIGLDEIFAGFDPFNQAVYLKFLDDLKLQWLITCPDELPYSEHLSAAMAYRLRLDDKTHSTFPILWDGRQERDVLHEVRHPSAEQDVAASAEFPEEEGDD